MKYKYISNYTNIIMAQYSNNCDNMIMTYLEKMITADHINHCDWEHAIKKFLNHEEIAFVSYINFTTMGDYMNDDLYYDNLTIILKYPPILVLNNMIDSANNFDDTENWLVFSEDLWEYIHLEF